MKSGTRKQIGSGARRQGYIAFLRVDLNKQEFLVELAKTLKNITLPQDKQLFTTILGDCASSLPDSGVSAVVPSTQEEANTRLFLCVAATTVAGHRRINIRTSDSDVVVLVVSIYIYTYICIPVPIA